MFYVLIAAAIAVFVYFVVVKRFSYWKDRGIQQQSVWAVWFENLSITFQTLVPAEASSKNYEKSDGKRYAGGYQFFKPILVIRDLDLIKQITVKDFEHFLDRNPFVPEDVDPLWSKNLVALTGEKWRDMRATLSPSFTSSKMRGMFGLMTECAQQFVGYFDKGGSNTVTVEMKDAFTRYTNDVIASTAFGISCDSLKERENEFYLMGKTATNFRGFQRMLSFMVIFLAPNIARLLGLSFFSKEVSSFFRSLVKQNIESREKNGIVRNDMIHLLMEARKGRLKHEDKSSVVDSGFAVIEESSVGKEEHRQNQQLSDDDLTAQALIFFFAGFETVSQLMCFTAHELAVNPDIQTRLREEVDTTLKDCKGHLTYEALLHMKYLDMVISETLRKWPGAIGVDRVCVKPYTIEPVNPGEKPFQVKKGEVLWVPIYAIHRDPQYYPEPERFDPERFSDENKGNIYPYSFLPFGVGPRSCIGTRFALLETKTVLFHLLSKFEILVTDKTQVPLKLAKNQFNPTAEKGFWLGLKRRTDVQ